MAAPPRRSSEIGVELSSIDLPSVEHPSVEHPSVKLSSLNDFNPWHSYGSKDHAGSVRSLCLDEKRNQWITPEILQQIYDTFPHIRSLTMVQPQSDSSTEEDPSTEFPHALPFNRNLASLSVEFTRGMDAEALPDLVSRFSGLDSFMLKFRAKDWEYDLDSILPITLEFKGKFIRLRGGADELSWIAPLPRLRMAFEEIRLEKYYFNYRE